MSSSRPPFGTTIRMQGHDYRIQRGGIGESKFVVDPVSAEYDPFILKQLHFYANLPHSALEGRYLPHPTAAVAEVIANNLHAQIVHIEMPEPLPEGVEPDGNVVY